MDKVFTWILFKTELKKKADSLKTNDIERNIFLIQKGWLEFRRQGRLNILRWGKETYSSEKYDYSELS